MSKSILPMLVLMLFLEQCAGPKSAKTSDNRSTDSASIEHEADLTSLGSEVFAPACSAPMDDESYPPQKPFVVFAYNSCGSGKVPSIVVGCTRRAVQANNANLSCTPEAIVAIDGIPVGTGGFTCETAENSSGAVAGCDDSNLLP